MRKTRSWKHNRKDRKQYMVDGKCKVFYEGWGVILEPVNTEKRNTPFMDLSDIEDIEEG